MRDIKFRAWHIEDKKMLDHKSAVRISLFTPNFQFRNGETILMQFTGFQDCKGDDIYEGDIVYVAGFGTAKAIITHEHGSEFEDKTGHHRSMINAGVENDIGKIIGNIHQNPELLEQNI